MTIHRRRVSLSIGVGLLAGAASIYACEGTEERSQPDDTIIPSDGPSRRDTRPPPTPFDQYAICLKKPHERKVPVSLFLDGGDPQGFVSVRARGKQLFMRTSLYLHTIRADGTDYRMLHAFYASSVDTGSFIVDDDGVYFHDRLNPKGEYALLPHDGGPLYRLPVQRDAGLEKSQNWIVGSDGKYLYLTTQYSVWRVDKETGAAEFLRPLDNWTPPVDFAGSSFWKFSSPGDKLLHMLAIPDASIEVIEPCPWGKVGADAVFCGKEGIITRFAFDGGPLPGFEIRVPDRDGGLPAEIAYAGSSHVVAGIHEKLERDFEVPNQTHVDIFVRRSVEVGDETVIGCSVRGSSTRFEYRAATDNVLVWSFGDGKDFYVLEY